MASHDDPGRIAHRYRIGVDGGGSGTRARLVDARGTALGLGEAGPSSLSLGTDRAWTQVLLAVQRAFAQARLAQAAPGDCAIGLGLAGAGSPSRAEAFASADPGYAALVLDSDATAALLGAFGGAPGALLAAGTGSVGLALHADGRHVLVGGWGFGVGDEGGGAWLGQRALQHAQQALDGRARAGRLARAIWQVVGGERAALIDWCRQAGQAEHAALAPLVFDAAGDPSAKVDGDAAARQLLAQAADELQTLLHAVDPDASLPLAITGSVGRRLLAWLPAPLRARCVMPDGDAAQGALLLLGRADR